MISNMTSKTNLNSNTDTFIKIIQGVRNEPFYNFIFNFLKRSKIQKKTIQELLTPEVLDMYSVAMTHKSAGENNYEYYELIGDSLVNTCIVWYINNKFPQLRSPEYVKIVARLKINLISKKSFYEFAEKLNFWDFVTASEEVKQTKMKKTMEDVFEALFGVTCLVLNKKGKGYNGCYNILETLMDEIHISLNYEDLYDCKTILKETFDLYKDLGPLVYTNERIDEFQNVNIFMGKNKILIGSGKSTLKIDAEQKAANIALKCLEKKFNIKKPIPEVFFNLKKITK